MRLNEIAFMAIANLWRRKLRTSLTILAVVIGATLVALMVSIGSGLQGFIVNQFGTQVAQDAIIVSTGTNLLDMLQSSSNPVEITGGQTASMLPFTADDLALIRAIPGVERVDFIVTLSALYLQPVGSDRMFTVDAYPINGYEAAQRVLFRGQHFAGDATGQCLLAYDYLDILGWSADEALGREINLVMGKQNPYDPETTAFTFTITGITERSISAGNTVIIPTVDGIEMARFYWNNPLLYSEMQPGFIVQAKAGSLSQVEDVADAINALGFSTITPNEILAQINGVFGIIQIGLGAFGGIALVVAAIGIINTLMMAIYERTREIGVMKAVGATRANIRMLFTAEGGALGFLGGAIGVLIAFIMGQLLNFIGARTFLSDYPGFKMSSFSPGLALGIVILTTVISLAAGLYPAARAARLDPVDALRYE